MKKRGRSKPTKDDILIDTIADDLVGGERDLESVPETLYKPLMARLKKRKKQAVIMHESEEVIKIDRAINQLRQFGITADQVDLAPREKVKVTARERCKLNMIIDQLLQDSEINTIQPKAVPKLLLVLEERYKQAISSMNVPIANKLQAQITKIQRMNPKQKIKKTIKSLQKPDQQQEVKINKKLSSPPPQDIEEPIPLSKKRTRVVRRLDSSSDKLLDTDEYSPNRKPQIQPNRFLNEDSSIVSQSDSSDSLNEIDDEEARKRELAQSLVTVSPPKQKLTDNDQQKVPINKSLKSDNSIRESKIPVRKKISQKIDNSSHEDLLAMLSEKRGFLKQVKSEYRTELGKIISAKDADQTSSFVEAERAAKTKPVIKTPKREKDWQKTENTLRAKYEKEIANCSAEVDQIVETLKENEVDVPPDTSEILDEIATKDLADFTETPPHLNDTIEYDDEENSIEGVEENNDGELFGDDDEHISIISIPPMHSELEMSGFDSNGEEEDFIPRFSIAYISNSRRSSSRTIDGLDDIIRSPRDRLDFSSASNGNSEEDDYQIEKELEKAVEKVTDKILSDESFEESSPSDESTFIRDEELANVPSSIAPELSSGSDESESENDSYDEVSESRVVHKRVGKVTIDEIEKIEGIEKQGSPPQKQERSSKQRWASPSILEERSPMKTPQAPDEEKCSPPNEEEEDDEDAAILRQFQSDSSSFIQKEGSDTNNSIISDKIESVKSDEAENGEESFPREEESIQEADRGSDSPIDTKSMEADKSKEESSNYEERGRLERDARVDREIAELKQENARLWAVIGEMQAEIARIKESKQEQTEAPMKREADSEKPNPPKVRVKGKRKQRAKSVKAQEPKDLS